MGLCLRTQEVHCDLCSVKKASMGSLSGVPWVWVCPGCGCLRVCGPQKSGGSAGAREVYFVSVGALCLFVLNHMHLK